MVDSFTHSTGFIKGASGDTIVKTANAGKPYTINWLPFLAGDTISTSVFTVGSGMTLDSESNTTTTSTATLSGGTTGTTYTITCQIVTAGGITEEHTFYVQAAVQ